jgi:hypothetical protein
MFVELDRPGAIMHDQKWGERVKSLWYRFCPSLHGSSFRGLMMVAHPLAQYRTD